AVLIRPASNMADDCLRRQTPTATPAEPGAYLEDMANASHDTRPHRSAEPAGHGRRGDRIVVAFFAVQWSAGGTLRPFVAAQRCVRCQRRTRCWPAAAN